MTAFERLVAIIEEQRIKARLGQLPNKCPPEVARFLQKAADFALNGDRELQEDYIMAAMWIMEQETKENTDG